MKTKYEIYLEYSHILERYIYRVYKVRLGIFYDYLTSESTLEEAEKALKKRHENEKSTGLVKTLYL